MRIDDRFNQIAELFVKPKKLYSFQNPQLTGKSHTSNVREYEKHIKDAIAAEQLKFYNFKLSYSLDTYVMDSSNAKKNFSLFFSLDEYLFILKSSGIQNAQNLDFALNYNDREYYATVDTIAKKVISEFMSFAKQVSKK